MEALEMAKMSADIDLRKIKAGNRKAQKALYDKYRVYLFGVANLYANSKEEAEDILQEGFYRIFKDIHSYRGEGDLRAWMRKVMVNSALMHLRKYRKWQHESTNDDDSLLAIPDNVDLSAQERANSILKLIRSLPEPQRIIFTLKGIEGYNYQEMSVRLNIKEATLRSHYMRARKKLQNILQKEFE